MVADNHSSMGAHPAIPSDPSSSPGNIVRIHVSPVSVSIRKVSRTTSPDVNRTKRGLLALAAFGRPIAGISLLATPPENDDTN